MTRVMGFRVLNTKVEAVVGVVVVVVVVVSSTPIPHPDPCARALSNGL